MAPKMRPSAISNETMLRKFLLTTFLIFIVFYLFSANNYIANNSASHTSLQVVFSPLIFEPLYTCIPRFLQKPRQQAFPIFPPGQNAVLCSLTHKEKTLQGQLTAQRTNTTRGRQIYYRHQKERMRKAAQREKRSTDKQRQKHL